MHFNRTKFFDGFRERLDETIEQEQVDGLEFLLGRMEQDPYWRHIPQMAYALATVFHETAGSFQPVEEGYYLGSARKVKAFQKTLRYYPYFGRGYVQLTWETKKIPNYSKATKGVRKQMPGLVQQFENKTGHTFDLVAHPEQALDPLISYAVLTLGMHQGWFTGQKLDDHIKGSKKDYKDARTIINGHDRAGLIAGYARSFEKILTSSAAAPAVNHTKLTSEQGQAMDTPEIAPPPPIVTPATPAPESIVAVQTPVVEVEQVKPETEDKIDQTISKWSARFVAVPAAVFSFLAGVWSWITAAPLNLTITLIITGSLVATIYFVARMVIRGRERREENRLKAEREARAHELQILTLHSAMNRDMNTVRIVPQPIANSDAPGQQQEVTA